MQYLFVILLTMFTAICYSQDSTQVVQDSTIRDTIAMKAMVPAVVIPQPVAKEPSFFSKLLFPNRGRTKTLDTLSIARRNYYLDLDSTVITHYIVKKREKWDMEKTNLEYARWIGILVIGFVIYLLLK